MRRARMGSMDAARCAGKNAATNVTVVMPANATRIVTGSLELKPYSIERKVVATTRDTGMPSAPYCHFDLQEFAVYNCAATSQVSLMRELKLAIPPER
jgi:hypothetical protein